MGAWNIFRTYPYFGASLIYLGGAMAAAAFCPPRVRRDMMVSGLMMVPFSLSSLFLEPTYWNPKRIAYFLTGPEDLLFTFACGALVWWIASLAARHKLRTRLKWCTAAPRFLLGTGAGIVLGSVFRLLGAGPMTAIVLSFVLFVPVIFILGGRLWPLLPAGAIGFPVIYFVLMKASFILSPDFIHQWNSAVLWGPRIWGVPIDEITGAAAFGLAWPLFAAYILDAYFSEGSEAAS